MEDKVLVSVRARPLIRREIDAGDKKNWACKKNVIQACHPGTKTVTGNPFNFDRVFGEDKSTSEIYNQVVSQIVEKSLQGYNGTVMCYGQTSSGKTHTLYGCDKEPGIISLTAQHLFELIRNDETRMYYIRVGLLEVYNEKVSDLLNNGSLVEIQERNKVVAPTDLKEIEVVSAEEMLNAAKIVQAKRKIGETKLNKQSSRSHTILRILIESVPNDEDAQDEGEQIQVTNALLNFVDLAGSEKANQTGAAGERFKEATFINKSLSVLSQVVLQLSGTANVSTSSGQNNPRSEQKPSSSNQTVPQFINYRDSKLTRLLQSSLSGNAYISLICNITSAAVDETASTLRFARTAKNIKLDPTKNQGPPTGAQYRTKITELENMLVGKSSEVENLRKKIVSIQKFCQPLQQQSAPTGPSVPIRRKTVGPAVLTRPRKEDHIVSQDSDSENSKLQAREQLLVFQLEKSESDKTLAQLTLQKVTERNQCLLLENKQLKQRLADAEQLLNVVTVGKSNGEAHIHSNKLSTEHEPVHDENNRQSNKKLHYAGSEVIILMNNAEQSRQKCANMISNLRNQIKFYRTQNP